MPLRNIMQYCAMYEKKEKEGWMHLYINLYKPISNMKKYRESQSQSTNYICKREF